MYFNKIYYKGHIHEAFAVHCEIFVPSGFSKYDFEEGFATGGSGITGSTA
jgi:hypothetical protein